MPSLLLLKASWVFLSTRLVLRSVRKKSDNRYLAEWVLHFAQSKNASRTDANSKFILGPDGPMKWRWAINHFFPYEG